MALPGGGLVRIAIAGGPTYDFANFRTSVPIITPTASRSYGLSLNAQWPVNRDGPLEAWKIRITWKFLALSNLPDNPYADVIAQLDALWHAILDNGVSRLGTVTAWQDTPGGAAVAFPGAIVPFPLQLKPQEVRHHIAEISIDVLGPFA